jgi:hypothetical protein
MSLIDATILTEMLKNIKGTNVTLKSSADGNLTLVDKLGESC